MRNLLVSILCLIFSTGVVFGGNTIQPGVFPSPPVSTDNTIVPVKLKTIDSPSDGDCLTYDLSTGNFEWDSCAAGVLGTMATQDAHDVDITGGSVRVGILTSPDGGLINVGDNTATKFYFQRDAGTGQFIMKTAQTGTNMTDTDAIYTLWVAAGGTLDTGQRVFMIRDDSNTYFFMSAISAEFLMEVVAPSFSTTATDNNFRWNSHNTGHPSSATLAIGDCYTTGADNTLRCSWDGESPGTSIGGSSMVYPGAGMAVSTGSAWDTSKTTPSGDVVGTSDSQVFTNKTFDANATGNVLKQYGYVSLRYPNTEEGGSSTYIQDNVSSSTRHQVQFDDAADCTVNRATYFVPVPSDVDSTVDMSILFKFSLGGADTSGHVYIVSQRSVSDSENRSTGTMDNAVTLTFAGDGAGASGDIETLGWTTLTGWAANVTADDWWEIEICRDGDHASDTSTVDSFSGFLVIRYGRTQ